MQTMSRLTNYKQFKTDFKVESYVQSLPKQSRSIMAKLRNGTFPVKMETGRYRNLKPEERICPFCQNIPESIQHFLMICKQYDNERKQLYDNIQRNTNINLRTLSDNDTYHHLINNSDISNIVSKFAYLMLQNRFNNM